MHFREVVQELQQPPAGYRWHNDATNTMAIDHAVELYHKLKRQEEKLQKQMELSQLCGDNNNNNNNNNNNKAKPTESLALSLATDSSFTSSLSSSLSLLSENLSQELSEKRESTSPIVSSTSEGSSYERHHRYDTPSTAFHDQVDLYGRERELELQERFVQSCKNPPVPFVPAGQLSHGLRPLPTRTMLLDCVRGLYKRIAHDWVEVEPTILTTAEDLIVVFFPLHRLGQRHRSTTTNNNNNNNNKSKSARASKESKVIRYMQNALRYDAVIREYGLNKVSEAWNITTEDDYLMFTLRPPWVKKQPFLPPSSLIRT